MSEIVHVQERNLIMLKINSILSLLVILMYRDYYCLAVGLIYTYNTQEFQIDFFF